MCTADDRQMNERQRANKKGSGSNVDAFEARKLSYVSWLLHFVAMNFSFFGQSFLYLTHDGHWITKEGRRLLQTDNWRTRHWASAKLQWKYLTKNRNDHLFAVEERKIHFAFCALAIVLSPDDGPMHWGDAQPIISHPMSRSYAARCQHIIESTHHFRNRLWISYPTCKQEPTFVFSSLVLHTRRLRWPCVCVCLQLSAFIL